MSSGKTRSNDRLLGMALFALAVCVYVPSFGNGFIWDDNVFLTENALIKASDGLYRFWFTREPPDYFPLTSTMLWLEWRVFGAHAAGYHVINVLLHATSCVLFWRVLRRLEIPGAWLAALLFAVHPVNVETVSWITERKNTLPMVLALAALFCYLRDDEQPEAASHRHPWYACSLVAFLLALLAKTSVVMLPCILLACAWWRRGRVSKRDVLRATPFFALSLALGLVTVWYQTYSAIGDDVVRTDGFLSRLVIAGRAVWFYVYKALVPLDLCFVYPRWQADLTWWGTYVPIALLFLCFAALVHFRRRSSRSLLFASSCYVLMLLPVLGFVNIYFMRYSLVADHWQYPAIAAVLALLAAAWTNATSRWALIDAGRFAAGLVIVLLAALTWREQRIYHDIESLWTDTLAKNPTAWIAHNNLGLELHRQGRLPEAVSHYEAALRIEPDLRGVHYNVGTSLHKEGRFADAIAHYRMELRLNPDNADAHGNLGSALQSIGRTEEALSHYETALRLNPRHVETRNNLGSLLFSQGRYDEAVVQYEEALRLERDSVKAHSNLGSALQELGKLDLALAHYEEALRLAPQSPEVQYNLGNCLSALGRDVEAIAHYETALRLAPQFAGARYHLALCLQGASRFDEALDQLEKLVELAPRDPAAHSAMATVLDRLGRTKDAASQHMSAVTCDPNDALAAIEAARFFATCGDASVRDGVKSLELAKRAVALTNHKSRAALEAMAAAYASVGDSAEAARWQAQALEIGSAAASPP